MHHVITIENLSKKYKLGQLHTDLLTEKIGDTIRSVYRKIRDGSASGLSDRQPACDTDFWALQGINLEIGKGEIVGFIGRNGAGKSTLLKILSRITEPTTGRIIFEGRMASLLEVGTGFHPELTGRENVYLNGAILGMTKTEIRKKFDEIVAFSEIEKFIDTPVKRYSSGMYVRLAFAVAAHLEPDILVIDEVLAVGDAQFQKKCLGKIENAAQEGRTILFVSHNMTAVRELCKRAVWLNYGSILEDGKANDVVSRYLDENAPALHEQVWTDPETAPGNEKVRLHLARISIPEESSFMTVNTPLKVEFAYWNHSPETELNLSLDLYNSEGMCIFSSDSPPQIYQEGLIRETCNIPGNLLNDGTHKITIMVIQDRSFSIYTHHDILVFDIQEVERSFHWYGKWPGVVRPTLNWTTEFEREQNRSGPLFSDSRIR